MKPDVKKQRNILIAVDESENAKRAVLYVRDLLEGLTGFHITIITIIPKPSEDYFASDAEKSEWIEQAKKNAHSALESFRQLFIQNNFREEDITTQIVYKECISIGECILDEQRERSCGTVVIGRRGISKKEEFIFGSTSNKILHSTKDCSIWVIE